jgi:hypothetical protein
VSLGDWKLTSSLGLSGHFRLFARQTGRAPVQMNINEVLVNRGLADRSSPRDAGWWRATEFGRTPEQLRVVAVAKRQHVTKEAQALRLAVVRGEQRHAGFCRRGALPSGSTRIGSTIELTEAREVFLDEAQFTTQLIAQQPDSGSYAADFTIRKIDWSPPGFRHRQASEREADDSDGEKTIRYKKRPHGRGVRRQPSALTPTILNRA